MKTNIKMRVTLEQSRRVQEICFKNNIIWNGELANNLNFLERPYLFILKHLETANSSYDFKSDELEEIDADLFIRTNGTCEENELKDFIQSQDENINMIGKGINKHYDIYDITILEQKLKKKNEILKKARIKRKNQREELHKLNLKLQKCISLEEHRKVINWHIERNESLFAEIDNLKAENIEMGKLVNLNKSILDLAVMTKDLAMKEIEELNKQIEKINKDNVNYLSDNILLRDKEIEKLKAVIEYLESKVK